MLSYFHFLLKICLARSSVSALSHGWAMSKYPKLLQPLSCEWLLPAILKCGLSFTDMHHFVSHVRSHLVLDEEKEEPMYCNWVGCDFSCSDSQEYTCHVLFHPYHSYQKLLGLELQVKKGLPACQLDSDMENIVPQLEIELRCQWDNGKCNKIFDSVGDFYAHVHEHAMGEHSMCCKWKGELVCVCNCLHLLILTHWRSKDYGSSAWSFQLLPLHVFAPASWIWSTTG